MTIDAIVDTVLSASLILVLLAAIVAGLCSQERVQHLMFWGFILAAAVVGQLLWDTLVMGGVY
jgi:hypothetical protein